MSKRRQQVICLSHDGMIFIAGMFILLQGWHCLHARTRVQDCVEAHVVMIWRVHLPAQ